MADNPVWHVCSACRKVFAVGAKKSTITIGTTVVRHCPYCGGAATGAHSPADPKELPGDWH